MGVSWGLRRRRVQRWRARKARSWVVCRLVACGCGWEAHRRRRRGGWWGRCMRGAEKRQETLCTCGSQLLSDSAAWRRRSRSCRSSSAPSNCFLCCCIPVSQQHLREKSKFEMPMLRQLVNVHENIQLLGACVCVFRANGRMREKEREATGKRSSSDESVDSPKLAWFAVDDALNSHLLP